MSTRKKVDPKKKKTEAEDKTKKDAQAKEKDQAENQNESTKEKEPETKEPSPERPYLDSDYEARDVFVDLSSEEMLEISDIAGKLNEQKKKVVADFDEQKQAAKNKIALLDQQLGECLKKMSTKKELRNVECKKVFRTKDGIVDFFYNGKKVDDRIMTESDRQGRLL